MTEPPLTVMMPVYNGMPYVDESIRSICEQSFREFEFVIGDDGSTDGTGDVLRAWAARDPRIRLLRRERPSGLAASANWVAAEARAPLVAVAHADDLSHPDRLRRQLEILRHEPDVDLVGSLWQGIDEEGAVVRPGNLWPLLRRSAMAPFSHSSIMFRRAAFERVGGYRSEAEYWEDLDLYFRIAAGGRVVVTPDVLATVRHSRNSTRLRDDPEGLENAVELMYSSASEYERDRDYTPLLRARQTPRKLRPRTFVSCGATMVWSGRPPSVLKRMLSRARLGLDVESARALGVVLWGTVSPRTLRFALRTLMHARNAMAAPALRGRPFVEWRPRQRPGGGA